MYYSKSARGPFEQWAWVCLSLRTDFRDTTPSSKQHQIAGRPNSARECARSLIADVFHFRSYNRFKNIEHRLYATSTQKTIQASSCLKEQSR